MEHTTIDTSAVSRAKSERLAYDVLEAVRRSLAEPGGAERLEAYAARYYARKKAKVTGKE